MAPIRRYLRISKYSVLECRIYLDNPALAETWLLNPRKAVLPRVLEAVRPLVLPKLREERERERSKKKSSKKKNIKDVVVADDFEVSIFLTETTTRHSILAKHKHFREKLPSKLQSNSSKLIGATTEDAIDVDKPADVPGLRREDSEDGDAVMLDDIPAADPTSRPRRSKRQRNATNDDDGEDSDFALPSDQDAGDDVIEVDSSDERRPPNKRPRRPGPPQDEDEDEDEEDDKKKLAMDVSYEAFAIYGSVLCLVVKKRDIPGQGLGRRTGAAAVAAGAAAGAKLEGQAVMENWISSTQMPAGGLDEDG